jgi:hypothetical protein
VPGVRRVLVGSYENQLFLLDAAGNIVQQYYPGFCMFQRTFVPGAIDVNDDGRAEKLMCSMKYGAQGSLHVLGYGTNGIAWHRNILIPDNKPYAVRVHKEKDWMAGVITPVGMGYYSSDSNVAVWERKGRPLSAGTVYLGAAPGESMRFVAAGFDNMVGHYDASGRCLGMFQSDEAVKDLAVAGDGQIPVCLLATEGGLRVYDLTWQLLDTMPGSYVRVAALGDASPAVLAVKNEGTVECIEIRAPSIDASPGSGNERLR